MTDVLKAVIGSLRLPFLLLTPVCLSIGFAAAFYLHGQLDIKLACLVLLGGLTAHISANTLNEFLDYSSGLDLDTVKTPFSGGSGSIPKCPRSKKAVLAVAVASLFITVLIGAYLGSIKGWPVWLIGFTGITLIILYTRVINKQPWLCLVSPGLAFGPLFVLGCYLCVTERAAISAGSMWTVFAASLLPFFLVNNLLLLNQLPDVEADARVGRVTFPVKYGASAAARLYLLKIVLAGLLLTGGIFAGLLPVASFLVLPVLAAGIRVYSGLAGNDYHLPGILPFLGANVGIVLAANSLLPLILVGSKLLWFKGWFCL
jgi:1,4-dihydroxy-2-naphthoate octaprenyltransferase